MKLLFVLLGLVSAALCQTFAPVTPNCAPVSPCPGDISVRPYPGAENCEYNLINPAVNVKAEGAKGKSCGRYGGGHTVVINSGIPSKYRGSYVFAFQPGTVLSSGIWQVINSTHIRVTGTLVPGTANDNKNNLQTPTVVKPNASPKWGWDVEFLLVKVPAPLKKFVKFEILVDSNCPEGKTIFDTFSTAIAFYNYVPGQNRLVGRGELNGVTISFGHVTNMLWQVGFGQGQKNIGYGASSWMTLTGVSITAAYTGPSGFATSFPTGQVGDINIDLECACTCVPNNQLFCGDGVIQAPEQCDGSFCCLDNCTYAPATQTCRSVAPGNECDLPEFCTGSSGDCPPDAYKPGTATCTKLVGLCDFGTKSVCAGDTPICTDLPKFPVYQTILTSFNRFNLVSFGNFVARTGDVEGRVAVKGHFTVGNGFSVGEKSRVLDIEMDEGDISFKLAVGLIVLGNLTWGSGAMLPLEEGLLYGENINVPDYFYELPWEQVFPKLEPDVLADFHSKFDTSFNVFKTLSQTLLNSPDYNDNVQVRPTLLYKGIEITCPSVPVGQTVLYVMTVQASLINNAQWWIPQGCLNSDNAFYLINVVGGDVSFSGGNLPAPPERTIWNIPGKVQINVTATKFLGNILAPEATLYQPGGVIVGKVIVGDVAFMLQVNLPDCEDLQDVLLLTKALSCTGLTCKVVSLSAFAVGDKVDITSNGKKTITGLSASKSGEYFITFDSSVDGIADADISGSFPPRTVAATNPESSGVGLTASFMLVATLLAFFF